MDAPRGESRGRRASDRDSGAHPGVADGPVSRIRELPLAGAALLDHLRVTGRPRPAADPTFTAELRAFLEDGIADLGPSAPPPDEGRWLVTPDRLDRSLSCRAHRRADGTERAFTVPMACGALVGVLFRQLVTVGRIADPMTEALEGLSLDDRQVPLVAWIEGLARAERAELDMEVARQARGLSDRWPSLDPSWLPRTGDAVRVPLGDGTVELTGRVDLAIGRPAGEVATTALVDLASGGRRPAHRHERGFQALVETLRSSVPPFAVATYYSRTGELDVEPVDHELLVAAAKRCLAGTRVLLGEAPSADDAGWCAACAVQLRRPPVVLAGGASDPPVRVGAEPVGLTREEAA